MRVRYYGRQNVSTVYAITSVFYINIIGYITLFKVKVTSRFRSVDGNPNPDLLVRSSETTYLNSKTFSGFLLVFLGESQTDTL